MQKKKYCKLSMFHLKIIACITMLIDHIACVAGWEGHDLLTFDTSWMRGVGRIAFPLFAFALAEGWHYTSDKTAYIRRMAIFACVSQIPYVLALDEVNITGSIAGGTYIRLTSSWKYWLEMLVTLLVLYVMELHKERKGCLMIGLAGLIGGVFWKVQGLWICNPTRNIGYLLLAGLLVFQLIDYATEEWHATLAEYRNEKTIRRLQMKKILTAGCILLLVVLLIANTGYDFGGLILLLSLYIFRKYRWLQVVAGSLWSLIFYGVIHWNYVNAGFAVCAFALIIFYNNQKGRSCKKLFYWFYPVHLLLLGCVNIFLAFK